MAECGDKTEVLADIALVKDALTCTQLAELLHLSVKTVHNRLYHSPERLPRHIRVEGRPLFPVPWVEEYLQRCFRVARHVCR